MTLGTWGGGDFDSYIKPTEELGGGDFRQLDVDSRCVLPTEVAVRFCVCSGDVIHAWSLNNMGVKLDAMAGVVSVFFFRFPLVGVFFGQCSEICGANHSFMPIVLEVCPFLMFKDWCVLLVGGRDILAI